MATTAPFPDFFVVGAPRCGTTSLSRYLARNPQICFSKPKEVHYFSRIGSGPGAPTGDWRNEYLRFFPNYHEGHRAVGEGSVSYLFSEDAIDRILAINPKARFIANVRNPIQMIRSLHYRLLYLLEEDEPDFAKAWRLQEARARGERIPPRCIEPRVLQYAAVGRLGDQIERLYRQAGRDQCYVVVFDDLVADTRKVYEQVLGFLGVDSDGRTEFPQQQSSQAYRFRWLQQLLYKPPGKFANAMQERAFKKRKSRIKRMRKSLVHWNRLFVPPPPIDEATQAEMREAFAADIEKLGGLLSRDLSHWR